MRDTMKVGDLLVKLVNRGKVDSVVLANLDGEIIAATPSCPVKASEVAAALTATHSNYTAMTKMTFCDDVFVCFHHDNRGTIVGRADDKVMVAHKSSQYLIIGLSYVESPGSCLYEVTEFGKHIKKRGL